MENLNNLSKFKEKCQEVDDNRKAFHKNNGENITPIHEGSSYETEGKYVSENTTKRFLISDLMCILYRYCINSDKKRLSFISLMNKLTGSKVNLYERIIKFIYQNYYEGY